MLNFVWVKRTISTVVALIWPDNTAIAPLSAPTILSPSIVLVLSDNPLTKTSLSKIGFDAFTDSKIPTILKTSGVFNEISLSWTLNP